MLQSCTILTFKYWNLPNISVVAVARVTFNQSTFIYFLCQLSNFCNVLRSVKLFYKWRHLPGAISLSSTLATAEKLLTPNCVSLLGKPIQLMSLSVANVAMYHHLYI